MRLNCLALHSCDTAAHTFCRMIKVNLNDQIALKNFEANPNKLRNEIAQLDNKLKLEGQPLTYKRRKN